MTEAPRVKLQRCVRFVGAKQQLCLSKTAFLCLACLYVCLFVCCWGTTAGKVTWFPQRNQVRESKSLLVQLHQNHQASKLDMEGSVRLEPTTMRRGFVFAAATGFAASLVFSVASGNWEALLLRL